VRLPHHPRDYAVLALLHLSFALRIIGGDLAGVDALRVLGGALGVVTLLAFVANAIASVVGARRGVPATPVAAEAPGASLTQQTPSAATRSSKEQV
jgi:succinate-acetate transporter protein